jgi:hypothetical protein
VRRTLGITIGLTALIAAVAGSVSPAAAGPARPEPEPRPAPGPALARPAEPGPFSSYRRQGGLAGYRITATTGARPAVPGAAAGPVPGGSQLETITFTGIERNGHAVPPANLAASTGAVNLATGKLTEARASSAGVVTITVPAGRYDLSAGVVTPLPGAARDNVTLIDDPEVSVTHDLAVTFDARRGVPISATLDRHEGNEWAVGALTETVAGIGYILWAPSLPGQGGVYAVPTPRVTDRPYAFLAQMQFDNSVPGPQGPGLATVGYSLEFPTAGRIPARLEYRVHDSSLATVRQDLRQQGKPMTLVDEIRLPLSAAFAPFSNIPDFALGTEFYLPPGAAVTEHLSPGSWETLSAVFYGPPTGYQPGWEEEEPDVSYRAGHSYQVSWGSAALGVASASTRLGDVITPDVLPDSASAPGHLDADLTLAGLSGTITLRRGATVLGTGSVTNQPSFTVPAASARYALSVTARRSVPWSTLGTAAQATWTFRSGHVVGASAAALPLWDIRISGAFGSLDRAPAGRPFWLTVAPDLPAGAAQARITSIAVAASFDNGTTWQRLILHRTGCGRWSTTVSPPAGSAFVSLSASLTDAAGNSTRQTVIRAYQLQEG